MVSTMPLAIPEYRSFARFLKLPCIPIVYIAYATQADVECSKADLDTFQMCGQTNCVSVEVPCSGNHGLPMGANRIAVYFSLESCPLKTIKSRHIGPKVCQKFLPFYRNDAKYITLHRQNANPTPEMSLLALQKADNWLHL